MARFIHDHSRRSGGPFFSLNCASLPNELAESELFGHEKGAFTGAVRKKRGLLELAESGSLLLNEIGELSPIVQAKLLTFLDTRSHTRVGGEKSVEVNARILAATNQDLEHLVEKGAFRKDLFFRLNVFPIRVPPLRERREDIPDLVRQVLVQISEELKTRIEPRLSQEAMKALVDYHWPGNVRELRNVLERAMILSDDGRIDIESNPIQPAVHDWGIRIAFPSRRSMNDVIHELKQTLISESLRRSEGNKQAAARLLGISRHQLFRFVKSIEGSRR